MRKAKARVRPSSYSEKHHITPRALGGGNEKDNIVRLTFREHFVAHWLLPKFVEGIEAKQKMLAALALMRRSHSGRIIASWQFEVARGANRASVVLLLKASWKRSEYRDRQIEQASGSMYNRWLDPEFRESMSCQTSELLTQLWADSAYRETQEQIRSSSSFREGQRAKAKAAWEKVEIREKYLATNTMVALRANTSFMKKRKRNQRASMRRLWRDPVWRANELARRKAVREQRRK